MSWASRSEWQSCTRIVLNSLLLWGTSLTQSFLIQVIACVALPSQSLLFFYILLTCSLWRCAKLGWVIAVGLVILQLLCSKNLYFLFFNVSCMPSQNIKCYTSLSGFFFRPPTSQPPSSPQKLVTLMASGKIAYHTCVRTEHCFTLFCDAS